MSGFVVAQTTSKVLYEVNVSPFYDLERSLQSFVW